MFKEILWSTSHSNQLHACHFVDDELGEFIEYTDVPLSRFVLEYAVKFYSERNLDVASNLMIIFRKYHQLFGFNSVRNYYTYYLNDWSRLRKSSSRISPTEIGRILFLKPYQEEIEKLFLLE